MCVSYIRYDTPGVIFGALFLEKVAAAVINAPRCPLMAAAASPERKFNSFSVLSPN